MNREMSRQVKELFAAASGLPAVERLAWVREQAGGSTELYQRVAGLLKASLDSGDFLKEPAVKREQAPLSAGDKIGSYRVLRELGSGGMGIVYLTVRSDETYHRLAALKIIRPELRTDPLVNRFLKERNILAQLDHSNIARIIDGGQTDSGLPYFVMDYVDGQPIDVFCAQRKATLTQRLNLFRQVCAAAQYLYISHVVHRDLKPANLLVTQEGLIKLIDFGIARQSSSNRNNTTGAPMATPDYASPEQILSKPVTSASDVYSLGVILYELLTGVRPLKLSGMSLPEMLKASVDTDPSMPSSLPLPASNGSADSALAEIHPRLSGDLDAILLMALRKEPERRYASPAEFAADVLRFQKGLPVAARRNSRLYVAGKIVKRHGVRIAAWLVVAASLTFGGITASQAIYYRRQIEKIRHEVQTLRDRYASGQVQANDALNDINNTELSSDLNQFAHDLQSTTPKVLNSPLAPRNMTSDLVQQSLAVLSTTTPKAVERPSSAAALGRAYLALAQTQWSPNGGNLNQPEQAAQSCEKAIASLGSASRLEHSGEVHQVVAQLLGALEKIPLSH